MVESVLLAEWVILVRAMITLVIRYDVIILNFFLRRVNWMN